MTVSQGQVNPHLIRGNVNALRPTQMTVGYREVNQKRKLWARLGKKARAETLANHCFPCVIGPKGKHYIVDHHHFGLALLKEGMKEVWLSVLKDLSSLKALTFWRVMEHHQWVHPYDDSGVRHDFEAIPKALTELQDDIYRSLAGELRHAGGYSKDVTPYSEYLWADFLRVRIAEELALADFDQALQNALALAHQQEAHYLPGWSGESKR